jgi:hypothetical protein
MIPFTLLIYGEQEWHKAKKAFGSQQQTKLVALKIIKFQFSVSYILISLSVIPLVTLAAVGHNYMCRAPLGATHARTQRNTHTHTLEENSNKDITHKIVTCEHNLK